MCPPGMEIEIYGGLGDLPLYNQDLDTDHPPAAVSRLREAVLSADALLWVTPEFNHSIPALVKNAIEWLSHPISRAELLQATSAVIVVTNGRGGYRGMADLMRLLRDIGGYVLPAPEVCVQFANRDLVIEDGRVADYLVPLTPKLISTLLESLEKAAQWRLGELSGEAWRALFPPQPMEQEVVGANR